jgi:PTS system nitrogen regulatory IIA component
MDTELLTVDEVARYLRIPRTTVYDLAQRRRLPAFKVGRHWRFKRVRLEAWLEQQDTMDKRADGRGHSPV